MGAEIKTKVALISLYNREFAFGVRTLSSVLRAHGHQCDIVFFKQMASNSDTTLCLELTPNSNFYEPYTPLEIDVLVQVLRDLKPDFIGLSLTSPFFRLAVEITARIKSDMDTPVVWGGIHPTLLPGECIKYTDMVCIGEGEGAILDLAEAFYEGGDISNIQNLWIKKANGTARRNEARPLIGDLDSLGFPDFSDDDHKYYIEGGACTKFPPKRQEHPGEAFNIMSSRGCPFRCTYCCANILREMFKGKGTYVRRRSVRSTIAELTNVLNSKDGINHIHFWDDVFTFDRKWIEEFSEAYKQDIGMPFTCYAHPEYTDHQILRLLKGAGLHSVCIGVQSGSEQICKALYHRQTNTEKVIGAARSLKDLDLFPWYDVIVDNPYEGDEDHRATLELLLALPRPFNLNIHSLCFFPRTDLAEKALRDGLITEEDIEGVNTKAIDQFRMSLDGKRSASSLFWNILIGMTKHRFFPTRFIRSCSRSKILRRFPAILRFFVVNTLRFINRKRALGKRVRRRAKLEIVELRLDSNGRSRNLHVKIDNLTQRQQEVLFALRSYPAINPIYPDRYLGAWNFPLKIPPAGFEGTIEISFPEVRFQVNSERLGAGDHWEGRIREPGLYVIQATLQRNGDKVIHNKMLYCHSSSLFNQSRDE